MTFISTHLDHDQAKTRLEDAYEKSKTLIKPTSKYQDEIRKVITGSHLTYRYILITNLLAKATNPNVNGLALQVGADFDGAFDSRSLCHRVFVPFERDFLGGRLGRSNEPYLNKPARHKALSVDNAVRKGGDSLLLETCIAVLSRCSQQEAYDGLVDAIHFTLNLASINDNIVKVDSAILEHEKLQKFAELLLETSNEGENCALLAGLAFHYISLSSSKPMDVRVHPVNQSGASSKEVLDIDVYLHERLWFTAEIKDKTYTKEDVDHAAHKVRLSGHDAMFFITGPKAITTLAHDQISAIGRANGITISVIPIYYFYLMALGLCNNQISVAIAWKFIENICQFARLKQVTVNAVQEAARQAGLIE